MSARFEPLPPDAAKHFSWTKAAPAAPVMAALEAARPGSARFVGGCVRDSLIGVRPKDIDIATTLLPEEVIRALKDAGLRAAPTGIEHGTVTGIADGAGAEITTLRADVSTDGRRATVAFTGHWEVDARRRDFTINALYLTTGGALFDPVGGAADLGARRVRFIGAPVDRIREDFLRILRFFRFSARFADDFDTEGLAACAAERVGLALLSAERVGGELSNILALARAPIAVAAMVRTGILAEIWPAPAAADVFAALKRLAPAAPAAVGFAALWGAAGAGIDAALRLSNVDAQRRKGALAAADVITLSMDRKAARAALYRLGDQAFRDGALLAAARAGAGPAALARLIEFAEKDAPPGFPFSGKDVIAAGVPAGPAVAAALKAAEAAWIGEDFPDVKRARDILEAAVRSVY